MGRIDRTTHARAFSDNATRITSARFIEPMLLLRTDSLPSGEPWLYELKLDGYRAIAFKRNGTVSLRSRNDNDFNVRYPAVVKALAKLPDNTVIDGEIVAFDQEGRPSFNALQNFGSARSQALSSATTAELQNSGHLARHNSRTRPESFVGGRQPTLHHQRWCFWTNRPSS